MKVVTFNVRCDWWDEGEHAWANREPLMIELLGLLDADILGLQEATTLQIRSILTAHSRYAAIGCGRDDGISEGEHCAILFDRLRFTVLDSGSFWLSETPSVPASMSWGAGCTRICTWAVLSDGMRRYAVLNTHLDHASELARLEGAKMVLAKALELPQDALVLVMGDWNSEPGAPEVGMMESRLTNVPAAGPTFHGYAPETLSSRIDYVFADKRFKSVSGEVVRWTKGGTWPSDHYPVLVVLE